jgi:hypothetical protein
LAGIPGRFRARIGDSGGKARAALNKDPPEPICLAGDRCYAVGDFTKSGYAIIRSLPSEEQDSMLFVSGMAHSTTHKHADELSFELFEYGRFIFVDSGKFGYKRDPMRRHIMSAAAHNTVSLDDRRIRPSEVTLSGSLLDPLEVGATGFHIAGGLERPGLFRQRREIIYDPGRSLTITDHMSADEEMPYVSSLHLAHDLVPVMDKQGFTVEVGEHAIRATLVNKDCRLEGARGQTDPLAGWQTTGYLKMTPASVVRAICPGRKRSIRREITLN